MKPIYKWSGKDNIFLLGSGSRPFGATSCGFSLNTLKSHTYGMPSGHSQIAWTISIYFICKLIDKIQLTLLFHQYLYRTKSKN